jgi:O-antigen/teichoic acid export membrane protein
MSVAPIIVYFLHEGDRAQYENNFRLALLFIIAYSLSVIVIVYLAGDTIVSLIYGSNYQGIGEVWLIYSLSCFGVGVGVFSSRMLVASNASMFIFSRAFFGLLLNVTLNYILIPKVGATGAAISTATSILCANLIFPAFSTVAFKIYGSLIWSVHKTNQINQTLNTWLLGVKALNTAPQTNENE